MLRFRRDRLYVGLEPHRVTLVRLSGTWRPEVVAAESFSAADGDDLRFIPELLEREFLSKRWQETRAQIVLADSLVRYFITPLPSGARNLRELRQAADLRFEEIFGDDAKGWTVAMEPAPLAAHHLGCAVKTDLAERIQLVCKKAAISLAGLAPFGIHEFNRHHRRIGHRSGWFTAIGPQTLWTALKSGNGWRFAHVHRVQGDTAVDLQSLLARQTIRAGLSDVQGKHLWVSGYLPQGPSAPWLKDTAIRQLSAPAWPGQSHEWSRTFRVALSPAWPTCA